MQPISTNAVVVDDDPMSLRVLAEALSMIDVNCTMLEDPSRLRSLLDSLERIDIIFVDLEMPQLDGYSVLRMLKEELQVEMPVVAYTVHTHEINNARRSGFDSFIGKPLRLSRFPDQFNRIVSGEGVWEAD